MKKTTNGLVVLALIVISIIVHWPWFFTLATMTAGDWNYQMLPTMKEFLAFPSLWTPFGLGGVNLSASFTPFLLAYGFLAHLGVSYGLSERLVFMWPIALVTPIASYFLIKRNIDNALAAFIGSLVFSYNTYFFSIKGGHLTLMAAFAFAPLAILFFQKALEEKKLPFAVLSALFLFIISFYEFRVLYMVLWLLFFYFLYFQFVIEKRITVSQIIKNCFYAGIPILIVGILNSYWIVGMSRLGSLTTNEIFSRALFGNEFLTIHYAMTLFHPFWTGGRPAEFITQAIPFVYWVVPLAAFLGLLLHRTNTRLLFFALIAVIGILLTKQVDQPFTRLYQWLYDYLPGFNAYREASKFYFFIALGYSVLIAGCIDWLWRNWTKTGWQRAGKYVLISSIVLLLIWNAKPAVTQELGTLFVPRSIPRDYEKVSELLIRQPTFSRALWVPIYSRWSLYTNTHPVISGIGEMNSTWHHLIREEKQRERYSEAELLMLLLQKPFADKLLDTASVRYVFVPLTDKANDDNFFRYYGKDRQYYLDELSKVPYLRKVSIGVTDIAVYENREYRPHLYVTEERESLGKELPYQKVNYRQISPTEYALAITNVRDSFYLSFSEHYHPQWKVRLGAFHWFEALTNSRYFLPERLHTKSDTSMNAYFIDPTDICTEYVCNRNQNGGYDLSLRLYFMPQSYTYLVSILSGSSLLILIGYLIFVVILRRRDEKKK